MKSQVFAVFDTKVRAFMTPYFAQTEEAGIRSFVNAAQDQNTMLCKNPEDFVLFHLGEYDDSDGSFNTFDAPRSIFKAIQARPGSGRRRQKSAPAAAH